MSSKILLSFLGGCLALFLVMGISTYNSDAQVVSSGKTAEPSGQLVIPFDNRGAKDTFVQVTNTNADAPVNLHIQIMNGASPTCAECDFFDTLSPLDTVVYEIDSLLSNENLDPAKGPVGARGGLPCSTNSFGVMVITPTEGANVDQAGAVAFNHLHGVVNAFHDGEVLEHILYTFNAVGRDAVLASGAPAADGTPVDGVTAGFELIIPNSYEIQYNDQLDNVAGISGNTVYTDAFFVAIQDDFSGGRYAPQPGTSDVYGVDVFDENENFQSCDEISFTCIDIRGVNNEHPTTGTPDGEGDLTCDPLPLGAGDVREVGCEVICPNPSAAHGTGYTRLSAFGGGDAFTNFGILGMAVTDVGGASHIFVK